MGIQFEIHFDFGELDVLASDTARCCAARAPFIYVA
jgi:hypothetical protein